MTNKEIYLKLQKRGRVSIPKLRDKVFPCTIPCKGGINPLCYKFLKENTDTTMEEIENVYYDYIMEFVKKKYPERVFALWMTSE